ncbi:MAG: hypothetical protein L6Q81_03445 [Bacteroidia bacterium]|nr:hypothetical protein [Bacteroidia bacterium]
MQLHVSVLEGNGSEIHLLSPFSAVELRARSTSPHVFAGSLLSAELGIIPGNIAYNKEFLVHLHSLVRDLMHDDAQVTTRAAEQENGFVFIIDRRSPAAEINSEENVDKEDIIGVFLCNNFKTDASKYRPNPDYLLVSSKGVGIFPEKVETALLR